MKKLLILLLLFALLLAGCIGGDTKKEVKDKIQAPSTDDVGADEPSLDVTKVEDEILKSAEEYESPAEVEALDSDLAEVEEVLEGFEDSDLEGLGAEEDLFTTE